MCARPNAKDYLEHVREAVLNEQTLLERLALARARCDVKAAGASGMPGSPNSDGDGVFRTVEAYMRVKRALEEEAALTEMLIDQAWGMLSAMKEAGEPGVDELEFYYLWGLDSREVGEMLNPPLSASRVRHRRKDILLLADKYVPVDAA